MSFWAALVIAGAIVIGLAVVAGSLRTLAEAVGRVAAGLTAQSIYIHQMREGTER